VMALSISGFRSYPIKKYIHGHCKEGKNNNLLSLAMLLGYRRLYHLKKPN